MGFNEISTTKKRLIIRLVDQETKVAAQVLSLEMKNINRKDCAYDSYPIISSVSFSYIQVQYKAAF